ncbi:uncharacterized protein LOC133156392 [Syngnathus typhle]|uniref:uncharacterized protein LOC133156392 n=1 Tax=Syngnathus typhle TaxID=161592 RepID=UPI002A6AB39D|nr:uncharacterized protein LOC133156392 [Syngnathus typhle]XP_061138061.1 uncharacterized protein LOC133156392 [Syngnathus typhle]
MNLVKIILLLCAHTADVVATVCDAKKDQVVFCATGNTLKIDPPTPIAEYEWKFGTTEEALPEELKPDASNILKGTLAKRHTGVYLAKHKTDPSQTDKFTVIVDAEPCTASTPCNVKAGGSIQLDSTNTDEAVNWEFQADGTPGFVEVTESDKPKFLPDAGNFKKGLGLFNVQKAESGIYRTKKTSGDGIFDSFPVHVRTPVSGVTVKGGGCDGKLECQVTGDAKNIGWTKEGTALAPTGKTLTVGTGGADSGKYACKATAYYDDDQTSPAFPYAYAVSTVSIERSGRVLTCVADGAVKAFEWLTFGNVPVTASDGKVGSDPSKFTLDAKAIGQFICKVTACDNKNINSPSFDVSGAKDPTGSPGMDRDNNPKPTAATQGASCSVALLVISVLIELYVVMMM